MGHGRWGRRRSCCPCGFGFNLGRRRGTPLSPKLVAFCCFFRSSPNALRINYPTRQRRHLIETRGPLITQPPEESGWLRALCKGHAVGKGEGERVAVKTVVEKQTKLAWQCKNWKFIATPCGLKIVVRKNFVNWLLKCGRRWGGKCVKRARGCKLTSWERLAVSEKLNFQVSVTKRLFSFPTRFHAYFASE